MQNLSFADFLGYSRIFYRAARNLQKSKIFVHVF